jgi:hypothetical protein
MIQMKDVSWMCVVVEGRGKDGEIVRTSSDTSVGGSVTSRTATARRSRVTADSVKAG